MAADCVTRVWALAIATAACIGLPSALIYAIVRVAAARRYGATFALALVLVFWVTVSAAYYPRVCADLVPGLRFLRRGPRRRGPAEPSLLVPVPVPVRPQPPSFAARAMRDPRGSGAAGAMLFPWEAPSAAARGGPRLVGAAHHGVPWPYPYPYENRRLPLVAQRHGADRGSGGGGMFPWEAQAAVARGGGARAAGAENDDDIPPSYPCEQQQLAQSLHGSGDCASTSRMMAALPREPPAARGKARAGDDDAAADVVLRLPPSKYCVICMADVDEEETAKRLPMCLHVFHRQCIDQWLQGQSTCPICRCNAFLTDSCLSS